MTLIGATLPPGATCDAVRLAFAEGKKWLRSPFLLSSFKSLSSLLHGSRDIIHTREVKLLENADRLAAGGVKLGCAEVQRVFATTTSAGDNLWVRDTQQYLNRPECDLIGPAARIKYTLKRFTSIRDVWEFTKSDASTLGQTQTRAFWPEPNNSQST